MAISCRMVKRCPATDRFHGHNAVEVGSPVIPRNYMLEIVRFGELANTIGVNFLS
jgi:hypothetical protein